MHADKTKILRLLKTVRGQIDGLIKMVEDDRYCIDISNQILASQSILKKVNLEILQGHLTHCVKESFEQGNITDAEQKVSGVVEILNKLLK